MNVASNALLVTGRNSQTMSYPLGFVRPFHVEAIASPSAPSPHVIETARPSAKPIEIVAPDGDAVLMVGTDRLLHHQFRVSSGLLAQKSPVFFRIFFEQRPKPANASRPWTVLLRHDCVDAMRTLLRLLHAPKYEFYIPTVKAKPNEMYHLLELADTYQVLDDMQVTFSGETWAEWVDCLRKIENRCNDGTSSDSDDDVDGKSEQSNDDDDDNDDNDDHDNDNDDDDSNGDSSCSGCLMDVDDSPKVRAI